MISTVLVTIVGIILIFVYAGHWVRIIILNLMILEIFPHYGNVLNKKIRKPSHKRASISSFNQAWMHSV